MTYVRYVQVRLVDEAPLLYRKEVLNGSVSRVTTVRSTHGSINGGEDVEVVTGCSLSKLTII